LQGVDGVRVYDRQVGGAGEFSAEKLIRSLSRDSNFCWQLMVKLPKLRCGAGDHARLIEIALRDFGIRVWLGQKINFVAIEQRREARAWLLIAQNALPFGINS
jgi:hypothetical protein